MRYQGRVTNWKDDQGFGFITPNGDGRPIFVHIKSFSNQQRRPVIQEIVTYQITTDVKGRSAAQAVEFINEAKSLPHSSKILISTILPIFITLFFAVMIMSGKFPYAILKLYVVTSILAFGAYSIDKSAAKNDRRRTRETTLHFLGLIGGWPGAFAAQKLLRHKSKKRSFQIIFWVTVAFNCSFLLWLLTPSGAEVLHLI